MAHISEAAPLQISRFYTGWYSYRNPLIVPIRTMGRRIIELYDAIQDGLNMEPSNRLTLNRRPGYSSVNSTPVNGRPINFFTFKPGNFPGQVYNMVDSTEQIVQIVSNSSAAPVPLVFILPDLSRTNMKPTPGLSTFAQVGAYLYIANESFMNKWDSPAGAQGITKWGIDVFASANQTGFNSPANIQDMQLPSSEGVAWTIGPPSTVSLSRNLGAATQGPSPPTAWEGMWQHMQNTAVQDGNFSTVSLDPQSNSPVFKAMGFNFLLPANAVVEGIQAEAFLSNRFAPSGNLTFQLPVFQLMKAGTAIGANRGSQTFVGDADFTSGGATDLWGTTWTVGDINNPEFGLEIVVSNPTDFQIVMGIDVVRLTVFYSIPADSQPLVSDNLFFRTYGFGLATAPDNHVTGIQVNITGMESQGDGIGLNVALTRHGQVIGPTRFITLPSNVGTVVLGGSNDLWNANWSPSQINEVDFGVSIQAVNNSAVNANFSIQSVLVNVFFIGDGPDTINVTADPNGTTAQTGFQWVYCYGNSTSGHISSPSFASPLLGPFTTPSQFGIVVRVSPDPQVNEIHVFRTTDGGGTPFFELPNSPIPNSDDGSGGAGPPSHTIIDTADDDALQLANIAPLPFFNDPPVLGATDPVWFGGRLWMHQGNRLFFASGPDVTMGSGEESWFPPYVFTIPGGQIIRKFSTPNGMIIIGTDNIYIVRGFSTASFTVNDFMLDIGMRTWTAADTDGSNIYLYTTDRQLLLINPNGLTSISQNIADRIQAVDPSLAYVAQYRFTATENWLLVSDGSTFIYPYNLELQAWATIQAPIGGVGAIKSMEVMPGIWQLWRGKPAVNQTITFRDLTSFRDEGFGYACNVIFGPIPVADFLTLAQMRDIVIATASTDTVKFASILPNEIVPMAANQFQLLGITSSEPPELSATPSLSYQANRYTWKNTTYSEYANFVFLRIDFSADGNPDQLFAWTLGGTQTTGGSSLGQAGQLPQIQGR
jgi:hypothetical protein